jgi:two-component system NtrC family response regulator
MDVSLSIITATNQHLEQLVKDGLFRADLYYRVSVAVHTMPTLREIRDDLPVLANHFREIFNREFRKEVDSIGPSAIDKLQQWDWPGNVRELRNVIERAMIFAKGSVLEAEDLPPLGGFDMAAVDANHVQKTAEMLGISRKNLWEKRKKYGLLEAE